MDSALRVIDEQEGLAAVLKGGTEAHAFIVGIVEAGDVGGEGEEESLGEWGADPSNSPKGEDTVVRGKSSPFRGIRGDLAFLELHSLAASLSLLLFAHRCCAATSAAKVREVVRI